jgi:hypothetical protein
MARKRTPSVTMGCPAPTALAGQSLGEAALTWASLGWSVFPIVPRGKMPYATGEFCRRTDDHTCGFRCATSDASDLAAWWTAHPDSNIGLSAPDAFIVDEDRIGALSEHGIRLPKCPWSVTGRPEGGRHFFLRAPAEWPGLRGDSVKVTYKLAGVEVKGFAKGYVVAAPSIHSSGATYKLQVGGYVPECPDSIVRQLVDVTNVGSPALTSLITIAGGGYQIPDVITENSRYKEITAYTAHLYNRPMAVEEMWPLVVNLLAPHFDPPLSIPEIRVRFERATKGMDRRLGDPRGQGGSTVVVPTALEDSPLTEFDSVPVEWLWSSWLPRGVVTLMDGNPGVSKSTVVADLIARITTGREWPDGTPALVGPQRAMWITTEDDPGRVLRPRIEAAGGDASLVRFVTSEVVFPQAATAFQELVVERASEPLGLALVVLDPLFSHIDAKVKSIADADMRQGVMNPLNRAAEAAGIAILVVRHFNKDTAASALNRGAGSLGGIVGAARAVWSATLDPEDDTLETKAIGVAKLNYAKAPPAIRYRVVDRLPPGWVTGSVSGIEWIGPAAVSIGTMMTETAAVGDAVTALVDILSAGPVGATAVKNSMRSRGFGREAVNSAAARIRVVKAKLGMTGPWEWSLPEGYGSEGYGSSSSASSAAPSLNGTKDTGLSRATLDTSSASSKDTERAGNGAPPAGARVREDSPTLTVVTDRSITEPVSWCHYVADHQSDHRDVLTDSPWCVICTPKEVKA